MSHSDDIRAPNSRRSGVSISTLQAENQRLQGQLDVATAQSLQSRGLFTDGPHVALLLTPSGRILEANVQAGLLLGKDVDILTGHRLGRHLAPASQHILTLLLDRVFGRVGRQEEELMLFAPDGALQILMVQVNSVNEDEESPWCQLVVMDVTVLKEAHRVLLDEVERLHQSIQTHHSQTRLLEEEVRQVFEATHTQLNLHISHLQHVLKLVDDEEQANAPRRTMQDVLDNTFVLLDSLNQYLQARQLRLGSAQVNLNRVLAEVRKELKDVLVGREVHFSEVDLPTVSGDRRALHIILHEYLLNALKFTRTRDVARIQVRVQETEGEYLIGVEDNGVGFNMRRKEKAFELFGRLHPGDTYEGVGLGLAVVRRLSERSGGRAWGEGKLDQGATFWFACPKKPRAQGEEAVR
ncbi:ATP-binding protein [Deinococcus altitudinis]|uniref:ATP-binding protein n=1 Tax=Deinococcus altitudinis TaxID=468914 RepID=UPI003891E64C